MEQKKVYVVLVEKAHGGKPIRQILVDALNEHGTISNAATSIGIRRQTLARWMETYGVKRGARVIEPATAEVAQ